MQLLLQWTRNKTNFECVCSPTYQSCNAHAPYCHLWPVGLYSVLPSYDINGTIFEETSLNIKCVFWFSPRLLSEIFLILSRIKQHIKNIYWSLCKVPIFLVRFWGNPNYLNRLLKKKCKATTLYQPLRSNSKRQHNSCKLTPLQVLMKLSAFFGTWKFTVSWAREILSMPLF